MNLKEIINFEVSNILKEVRTKFDLRKFKSIKNIFDKLDYASKYLKRIDRGSSRVVFLLSNRFVLKLAYPYKNFNAGLAQNETEVEIYTNPKLKSIVAKIYDFDPNYEWLISELVRPINDDKEFYKLTGISDWDMSDIMNDSYNIKKTNSKIDIDKFLKKHNKENNIFLRNMLELINQTDLHPGDLDYEQWGKTPDDRLVLLDYGVVLQ